MLAELRHNFPSYRGNNAATAIFTHSQLPCRSPVVNSDEIDTALWHSGMATLRLLGRFAKGPLQLKLSAPIRLSTPQL